MEMKELKKKVKCMPRDTVVDLVTPTGITVSCLSLSLYVFLSITLYMLEGMQTLNETNYIYFMTSVFDGI